MPGDGGVDRTATYGSATALLSSSSAGISKNAGAEHVTRVDPGVDTAEHLQGVAGREGKAIDRLR